MAALVGLGVFLSPAKSEASATSYQHLSVYSNPTIFDSDSEPQQMAVDEQTGNLFVADHAHHQIHVFAPDADTIEYLTSFGSNATIEHPIGVAVDPNTSDIYVSAAGNSLANGLVRFNQNEALGHADPSRYEHDTGFALNDTSELGSLGSTSSDFIPQPGGIVLAEHPSSGPADILVLDPGNDRVHRFDSAGNPVATFSGQGHFDGPSSEPFQDVYSIAADAEGNFTVADAPGGELRIASFQEDGTFIGKPDSLPAQAGNPGLIGAPLGAKPANGDLFAASREPVFEAEPEVLQYFDQELEATRDLPGTEGRVFGVVAFGDFDQTPAGRLYVGARETPGGTFLIHAFSDEGATVPPVLTIDPVAPEDVGATAAEFSGTVNPNDGETLWAFEYRRTDLDPAPDWTRMDLEGPLTGTEPVGVSATATELEPNLAYEVRLFGDNGDQQTETTAPESFHTDPAAPGAETGRAWSTTADSTTLTATINPRNSETEYRFEYGTDETYGKETSARSAGSGGDPIQVTAEVEDLSPDTTYHFRVVAENVDHGLTSQGDDASFETRTAQESRLPERGYELVSRREINGIPALAVRASESGDAYVYMTQYQPSPGAESAENTYQRMTRNPDGTWSPDPHMPTPPVDPDASSLGEGRSSLFSGSLSLGLFRTPGSYNPDDRNGVADAYTRNTETGELTWLSRDPDVPAGEPQPDERGVGAPQYFSSDGRRAVFVTDRALRPTHESGQQLYLWDDGELHHVSIPPDGSEAPRTPTLGSLRNTTNAVSPDGGRAVFNDRGIEVSPLYVRWVDEGVTHEVGGGDDPNLGEPAAYFGADSYTTQIVYVRESSLYVYDVHAETSTEVASPVDGMNVSNNAGVANGVFAVSEDAERIYFSSEAELTGEASGGERYLYLAERQGSGYEISLITPIHPDDRGITLAVDSTGPQTANQVDSDPSGSVLAFTSHAELVPGRRTGGFAQIYAYERKGDRLYCASCPPDGSAPEARADVGAKFPHGTWRLNVRENPRMPAWRNVSAGSGSVFFQSESRLTEGDSNDALDVYEWRGGELQLISSGRGRNHDFFADASEDGETVYFRSQQDVVDHGGVEGLVRIYAARIGGGFVPPERSAPCRGEECRGRAHQPDELSRQVPAKRARPHRAAPPALRARCARIVRRAIAVNHRARVLRVIARRSTGRRRALVARRARFVTRRAVILRVHAKRCRRAVR